MKRAALYVRVSTIEQREHGLSVDNQIAALKAFCESQGMNYQVYNDAGISGHSTYRKRPAMLQLIEDCRNRKIDLILFTRLDRWFRSVKDYYLVQDQIGSVAWRAIWEDYETETSSGQLKVNIMLSVAEAEASRTSEKVKSVLAYKKEKGEHCGRAPIGFKIEDKRLVPDPEAEEFVRTIFRTYMNTFSIERTFYECKSICSISQNGIRVILHNPVYVGPYITEDDHRRIAEHMHQHLHTGSQRPYIFGGLIRCPGCGAVLTGSSVGDSRRYRCNSCHGFQIVESKVENMILRQIEPQLDECRVRAVPGANKGNDKKISDIRRKADRLKELYIDGEIERAEYDKRKASYEAEIAALKPIEQKSLPVLPPNWRAVYDALNEQNKRTFWRSVLRRIDMSADKKECSLFF